MKWKWKRISIYCQYNRKVSFEMPTWNLFCAPNTNALNNRSDCINNRQPKSIRSDEKGNTCKIKTIDISCLHTAWIIKNRHSIHEIASITITKSKHFARVTELNRSILMTNTTCNRNYRRSLDYRQLMAGMRCALMF